MQISDLANLSTQEKLLAMEARWVSLNHDGDSAIPSPEWHARELSIRFTSLKEDKQSTSTWEVAKTKLRKLTAKLN